MGWRYSYRLKPRVSGHGERWLDSYLMYNEGEVEIVVVGEGNNGRGHHHNRQDDDDNKNCRRLAVAK